MHEHTAVLNLHVLFECIRDALVQIPVICYIICYQLRNVASKGFFFHPPYIKNAISLCLFVAELGVDGLSVRACVEPFLPGWLRGGRARAVHAQHGLLSPRGGRLRGTLSSPGVQSHDRSVVLIDPS